MSLNKDDVYVFYGALRSGTTMLRLMFDGHPEINCPGERDFTVDHLQGAGLTLDKKALAQDWIFRASGLSVPEASKGTEAFWEMVAEDKARSPKRIYMLVLHRGLETVQKVFPEARYIHLLRDPRDVARSSIGMGWAGNTWYGVDHWVRTEEDWLASTPPRERVFDLRYESLVADAEGNLQELCSFLGLDYTSEMLTFPQRSTYDAVDPKLAEQWRGKQTPAEVSELEYKLGDLLGLTGYAASEAGPNAPSLLRRMGLRLQDRRAVWAMRIERFGLVDSIVEMVSRRLGLESLGRSAKARMDERMKEIVK